jgi:hypothetical protein
VFDFIDPRALNMLLGVTIGMTLSLLWHAAHALLR